VLLETNRKMKKKYKINNFNNKNKRDMRALNRSPDAIE